MYSMDATIAVDPNTVSGDEENVQNGESASGIGGDGCDRQSLPAAL